MIKNIKTKLNRKYRERIKSNLPEKTLLLGFKVCSENRLDKNKIILFCEKHGEISYPQISNFLQRGTSGCKQCAKESRAVKFLKDEHKFTQEVLSQCNRLNCNFEGYVDNYKGSYHSECKLVCNEHGETIITNCRSFIKTTRKTSGCSVCINEHFLKLSKERDNKHIKDFLSTGRYEEGTTFVRDEDRTTKQGARNYWTVNCGCCGETYSSFTGSLKSGRIGCSCGKVINNMGYYPERDEWIDTLYLLKMTSVDELFYKIGRSFVFDRRLSNLKAKYGVEVISTVSDTHKHIFKEEQNLLKSCKLDKYKPKISFGGEGECFTEEILTHPEIISTFNL